MPKFKFLRLLIGFPIIVAGVALPCVDTWPWVFYFLGMMVALVGGYILTRSFDYELCGIGFAIIGFPLLIYSMLPGAYQFLSHLGADPSVILVTRFGACLIALICLFASFHED